MNPIVKEKWLTALESGEYNFGTGVMYNFVADTHCPLGVLAEIALEEKVLGESDVSLDVNCAAIEGNTNLPNSGGKLLSWSGLSYFDANAVARKNDKIGVEDAIAYIKEKL